MFDIILQVAIAIFTLFSIINLYKNSTYSFSTVSSLSIKEIYLLEKRIKNNEISKNEANIKSIDNCITRLRLEVKDSSLVDEKKIKSAGAAGVIRPSKTAVQVVIGTKVQFVADEFKKLCR